MQQHWSQLKLMIKNIIMLENNVITIDGTIFPKKECRKIKSVYYKLGDKKVEDSGQCYCINGKYYKYNTGYIVYDHRIKEYVIKKDSLLIEGIINITENGPIYGYYSKEDKPEEAVFLAYDGASRTAINSSIIKDSIYTQECLSSGYYFMRQEKPCVYYFKINKINQGIKNALPYDARNYYGFNEAIDRYEHEKKKIEESATILKYGKFVKDYTFGLEFETVLGEIPGNVCNKNGLIALRDGSIGGLEYVTVPLSGTKGLQTIVNVCNELQLRTTYDDSCSVHFHIGNVPRTEEFFISLIRILSLVEDEVFSMFPIYKRKNYGVKRKCYTKPFPFAPLLLSMDRIITKENAGKNFSKLYEYLSTGNEYPGDLSKVKAHPSDPDGQGKWNIKTRYHWVNLIPLLFGNKQTIEFRIHTPTNDYNKIISFLYLCIAIIDYAKELQESILLSPERVAYVTLNELISMLCMSCFKDNESSKTNHLYDTMNNYCRKREMYIDQTVSRGDIVSLEDNFEYNGIEWNDNRKFIRNPFKFVSKGKIFNQHPVVNDNAFGIGIVNDPVFHQWAAVADVNFQNEVDELEEELAQEIDEFQP